MTADAKAPDPSRRRWRGRLLWKERTWTFEGEVRWALEALPSGFALRVFPTAYGRRMGLAFRVEGGTETEVLRFESRSGSSEPAMARLRRWWLKQAPEKPQDGPQKAPERSSREVTWHTEAEERYTFLTAGWDVRAAKRLIVAKPRPVKTLSLEGTAGLAAQHNGESPDPTTVDLAVPLVVVTTPAGHALPIDGWNRIRKALAEGRTELPAVFLTKAESQRVRFA